MTLAQVETAVEIVDKASRASDRWLFLAVLLLLMGGGALCIRWLVKSLEAKDKAHKEDLASQATAHEKERTEWRVIMQQSKQDFLTSLDLRDKAFSAELSNERHQCAQERTLDREARHAMANALQSISNVLMKYDLDLTPKNHHE